MRNRKLAFIALLMSGVGFPEIVLAQPANQPVLTAEHGGVDDIVVTARRKNENLLDVPVAVTVLSGNALAEQRIENVEALRFVAPALQVSPTSFGKSVPGYTIRSQRSLENLITQDPAVGIYFAEVVQQRPHGTNASLYDLESVEVLKGPQGTLFGRNTTGGAILINPAKPDFDFGGSIQLEGGNYDLKRGTMVLNIPLSDVLAVRAAGRITRRDGFVRNLVSGRDVDDERTESARVSLLWKPNDMFSSYFVANYFHENDAGQGFALASLRSGSSADAIAAIHDSFARQSMRDDFWTVENNWESSAWVRSWSISNTSTLETGGVTLKNIFGYRKVKSDVRFDYDGTPAAFFESRNRLSADQWTEELQISGDASNRLSYIGGIYFFRERGSDTQDSLLFGTRANDGEGINESSSVYAQFNYKLTDRLNLTAGGRYTWDDRRLLAYNKLNGICRLVNAGGTPLDPCIKLFQTHFQSPSWLISLDYKPNDDTLLYLSHRRGYRSGGWNLRANRPSEQVPFDPEDVYDVEAGVKAQLFDRKLTINAAAYYQWYKGIQRTLSYVPAPGQALATVVLNAADATIKGGELEVNARPVPWLDLGASVAYSDPQYDAFMSPDGQDFSINHFAMAPKWTYTLRGRVIAPLPAGAGELSVGASYYHQSEIWVQDLNSGSNFDLPIKAYGVMDINADWRNAGGGPVDVGLFVKNVTKTRYYTGGASVYQSIGTSGQTLGEPRQIGFSLKYRFGAAGN